MSLTDFEVPPTRLAGQGLDRVGWAAWRRGSASRGRRDRTGLCDKEARGSSACPC